MVTGSGLFLLGILSLLPFPFLPPFRLVWLLPILLPAALLLPRWRYPAWYLCGFLWILLAAHQQMDSRLEPALQGVPLTVTGKVVSLPEETSRYSQFEFSVSAIRDRRGRAVISPGRIRLNWYRPHPEIIPGDRMQLAVKLKRPHGYMNPGGFDYEGWLFRSGIRARGYVLNAGDDFDPPSAFSIHRWRHHLREAIDSFGQRLSSPALVKALALGDRSEVERRQWRVLNHTGTNHLLAISGLHIGLVAGIAFFLARWLWPLWRRAPLWLPAQHAAAFVSLAAAAGYAMLAGFTIPTQRALVMIATLLLARVIYRRITRKTGFALALLAVLLLDPFAVLSPGFWLSFSAVAVILLTLSEAVPPPGRLFRFARIQWFLFLGLAPLLAFWFQQIPLLSILANSLAIPWISMVSVPLILAGTSSLAVSSALAELLLVLGDRSLALIWTYLQWLADMDAAVWRLPEAPLPVLFAALAGTLLLLAPRATPAKWMGVFLILPLLFPRSDAPEPGTFRFTLLDVGQGLAAAVRTRDHVLTYDTGPAYGSGFNTGWAVVVPFLRQAGIDRIDTHIQSHGDNDHIGGLEDLIAAMPVQTILSSHRQGIDHPRVRDCRAGQKWRWDGVDFRILHPRKGSGLHGNDRSCVLRVSAGGHSVLLPGDIERRGEFALLDTYRDALDASILVVPHHGSLSSSHEPFVRAVTPRYALFSAGYLNRYGFPKQAIIKRYRDAGAVLFETTNSGAIQFRVGQEGIDISRYREESMRFWHNRP